jgi:hypothetical protein
MLEVMIQLELIRGRIRKWMLPNVGSNDYHLVGSILALIFASGTLGSAFVSLPATGPIGGFSVIVVYITGVLAILTIVLWPIGLILL